MAYVFKYMLSKGETELGYNDFCRICEEKRRNIDPYESIIKRVKERNNSIDSEN